MDAKEIKDVIMFLENCIHHGEEDDLQAYEVKYNYWMKKIIILLQRGEKYEAMWGEYKEWLQGIYEHSIHSQTIVDKIDSIEQKYFPKEADTK